jgi:hypothetical protein
MLSGVVHLAPQRFLRDASLWRKGFQKKYSNFRNQNIAKKLIFLSTLFGASFAQDFTANRRTN